MIRYLKTCLLFLPALLLFSCISPKSTIYLQNKEGNKDYKNVYTKANVVTENYKINTNDYLYIRVITENEKVAAFYNLSSGSGNNSNMMMQQSGGMGAKMYSYLVDDNGEIDFPSLGKVKVKGLTRSEVKQKFNEILKKQIDHFTLMVELSDTYFTILGEAKAGKYSMSKDQISIYEAIAISGDLTIYSKRKQVKIIRPTMGGCLLYTSDAADE